MNSSAGQWHRYAKLVGRLGLVVLALVVLAENYLAYLDYPLSKPAHLHRLAQGFQNDAYLRQVGVTGPRQSQPSFEDDQVIESIGPHGDRLSRPVYNKTSKCRVLVIGCSDTFGVGVPDSQTYVWILNQGFPDICLDNYGAQAYGPQHCAAKLKHLYAGKLPSYDLIIYATTFDHRHRCAAQRPIEFQEGGNTVILPYARQKAPTLQFHPAYVMDWPLMSHLRTVNFTKNVFAKLRANFDAPDTELNWLYSYYLRQMLHTAQEHQADFAVAFLNEDMRPYIDDQLEPQMKYIDAAVHEKYYQPQYRVKGVGHPTAAIHAMWAKSIGNWLANYHTSKVGHNP